MTVKKKLHTISLKAQFFDYIKNNSLKIIGTGIALFFGYIGFYLSPLKEIIFHRIWKEDVEIKFLIENKRIFEGENLSLQLVILPKSRTEISDGFLELSYNSSDLALLSGRTAFNTVRSERPLILPDNDKVVFSCNKTGTFPIIASYQTKYGNYRDSTLIEVIASRPTKKITSSNFSGTWTFQLQNFMGKMEINQKGSNISGGYEINNGELGSIDGIIDGSVFRVDFIRKGALVKWHIQANWQINNRFLEIKGKALLLRVQGSNWVNIDTTKNDFYSTVML